MIVINFFQSGFSVKINAYLGKQSVAGGFMCVRTVYHFSSIVFLYSLEMVVYVEYDSSTPAALDVTLMLDVENIIEL